MPVSVVWSPVPKPNDSLERSSPTSCKFPMEIVLVQDTTVSFSDDVEHMSQGVQDMAQLTDSHPDSRAAIVAFKDKPLWPLGTPGEYCAKLVAPFTRNLPDLAYSYRSLLSQVWGGGDGPEASLHAVLATALADEVYWTDDGSEAYIVRLIVLLTDGAGHHAEDGMRSEIDTEVADYEIPGANETVNFGCGTMYYPSIDQVRDQLEARDVRLAMLVSGADHQAGLVGRFWSWVNDYLEQPEEFYQEVASDSSDFWEKLQIVIRAVEMEQCGSTAEPPATLPPPTGTGTGTEEENASTTLSMYHRCPLPSTCPSFGCSCCCTNVECVQRNQEQARRIITIS
eukprot:Protomagalhaensia_wolfi_Nauph_80__1367@NODE_1818_length_1321_cov_1484_148986_g1362_i1_p1_GENE_NODE_1818_length_1321_cov_1484_148986_g1362_i1NODE_1818_length_1321_cov_1484_148986_g1362_i1_p1_ORF_typecomplete_len340_score53_14Integrin_beta/PF00362_18/1_4e18VWA/PF00092_28/1_6e05VWA_2/PF13519_6/0_00086VWA_2/PF13519_6/5_9e03VWA_3/PF13768_6/0_15_NODE_1818_length_1321_cov_1484_148986_g1362_i11571176